MKEEEERMRKEEEEMRIQRQYEEERQRKAQEEKKRMRIASDRYDDDEMGHEDSVHSRRSNPPKSTPKTHRVEKPAPKQPQPKRAPPPTQTSYQPGGEHTAIYDQALNDADAFQNDNVNLVNCYNCGRKFAEDRIEKHEQFCKNLTKKRKVMDPTKTRTQGTELEKYQDPRNKKNEPTVRKFSLC